MTTKKFEQMTTKKLNALLATATDAERVEIEKVLATREQAQKPNGCYEAEPEEALTPEQEAMVAEAEANNGKVKASAHLSDEERHALAEQLKENVGHRCQVVPFNTAEWLEGYIAGVMEEKRSNKVMYAIKLNDGRRIVKVHDSNLLKIFDEVVTIEKKPRSYKTSEPKGEWTHEAIAEAIDKVKGNVGKLVTFAGFRSEVTEAGRITGLVPEKRAQTILYRIEVPAPTEEQPDAIKIVHKTCTNSGLVIAEDFDEIGAEINAKFIERREKMVVRQAATPQDRVAKCEEALAKAQEKLARVQEEVNARLAQLEDAKKDLAEYLATAEASVEASAEEPLD